MRGLVLVCLLCLILFLLGHAAEEDVPSAGPTAAAKEEEPSAELFTEDVKETEDDIQEEHIFWKRLFDSALIVLIVLIATFWLKKYELPWPSESALQMMVGIGIAGIATLIPGAWQRGQAFTFNDEIFTAIILPAVVIQQGFHFHYRNLKVGVAFAAPYAFLSTFLSFFLKTLLVYLVIHHHMEPDEDLAMATPNHSHRLVLSMFIGSVMSVVEPASVLGTLEESYKMEFEPVNPPIHTMLKAESIISICLMYDSTNILMQIPLHYSHLQGGEIIVHWIGKLLYSTALSVVIGCAMGFLLTCAFRIMDHRKQDWEAGEMGLIILFQLAVYWGHFFLDTEFPFKVSPVLALFVSCIVMANFTWKNLSAGARYSMHTNCNLLGTVAESYSYAILGATLFDITANPKAIFLTEFNFFILGVSFGVRCLVVPIVLAGASLLIAAPKDYPAYYPDHAVYKLSEEDTSMLTLKFVEGCKKSESPDGTLDTQEIHEILSAMGHTQTIRQTHALCMMVDYDSARIRLNVREFLEIFQRTGWTMTPEPTTRWWFLKTSIAQIWAGNRGHIAFGAALTAMENKAFTSFVCSKDLVDDLASMVWFVMSFGILIQGSLGPFVLKAMNLLPPPEEEKEEVKLVGARSGSIHRINKMSKVKTCANNIMDRIFHDRDMIPRHRFMTHTHDAMATCDHDVSAQVRQDYQEHCLSVLRKHGFEPQEELQGDGATTEFSVLDVQATDQSNEQKEEGRAQGNGHGITESPCNLGKVRKSEESAPDAIEKQSTSSRGRRKEKIRLESIKTGPSES